MFDTTFYKHIHSRDVFDALNDRFHSARDIRPEGIGFRLPPITSDLAYAIALHEFGHATHHKLTGPLAASSEVNASQWALDNARYWSRNMSHGLLLGLWTYVNPMHNPIHTTMTEFDAFAERVQSRELRDGITG